MKRYIALTLCICMILCAFCGCKKKPKVKHSVDIIDTATSGKITESPVKLGDSIDDIKDVLFEKASGRTFEQFTSEIEAAGGVPDGNEYSAYLLDQDEADLHSVHIQYDGYKFLYCLYDKNDEKAGVKAIAIMGEAYKFPNGTSSQDVRDAIAEEPQTKFPKTAWSFLPKENEGATVLTYDLGTYSLDFYFVNDSLNTTVLRFAK